MAYAPAACLMHMSARKTSIVTMARSPRFPFRAAYYNDIFAGVVGCRIEPFEGTTKRLYVTVCAVLAPYRNRGIGA
jgi:hypothetical protein